MGARLGISKRLYENHDAIPTCMKRISKADREKRRVALSSLAAAVLLTSTKLGIGIWTNSLGILSEAAHSGLDLVAAAITLWAVRISSQPADREHPYGHGKFENLSALFETFLLLVTCVWIIKRGDGPAVLPARRFELRLNIVGVSRGHPVDCGRFLAFARPEKGRRQILEPGVGGRCPALFHRHLVLGGRVAGALRRVGERDAWDCPG